MAGIKHINVSTDKGVMQIGIHRPDKKNALTNDMYHAMRLALENAEKDQNVKVMLLHGTKDAFCAGNDLEDFNNRDPDSASPATQFLGVLQTFKKPVIAAVSGVAVGVGVTMLLHCDLVYAAPNSRFRMPFVNLGVCPEAGSSLLLPANAGYKKAAEALMLGNFFDAQKAMEMGIVNDTISTRNLLVHVIETAEQLAQKPQKALLLTKQLLKQGNQQEVADRMRVESKFFNALLLTPESLKARGKIQNKTQKNKDPLIF